jgi:hypothetical protein
MRDATKARLLSAFSLGRYGRGDTTVREPVPDDLGADGDKGDDKTLACDQPLAEIAHREAGDKDKGEPHSEDWL